jgi:hypothetical protein
MGADLSLPNAGPGAQRTIVLNPGWHLSGPPTRTRDALHLAVRNDAGVEREVRVRADGSISFAPMPNAAGRAAEPSRRAAKPPERRVKTAALPLPRPRPADLGSTADAQSATIEGASMKLEPESRTTSASAPQQRATQPPPVMEGPGFAHGVPINPLE